MKSSQETSGLKAGVRWLLAVVMLVLVGPVAGEAWEYDPSTCRETSLRRGSTWPSDHGDSSRSKYTLGAGLPRNFSSDDLKRVDNSEVGNAQWIYHAGDVIYALGGSANSLKVAKYDALNLETLQTYAMKPALYIGGMLLHENGHVYAVHGNTLYVFWDGDLSNSTMVNLPTNLNSHSVVQTNGMVVTHDGLLVIKQWPYLIEDMTMVLYRFKIIPKIFMAILAILLFRSAYNSVSKSKPLLRVLLGLIQTVSKFCLALAALAALFIVLITRGVYDVRKVFFTHLLYPNIGELKLIDPISLEVVAAEQLQERCSFARMALSTVKAGEEDVIYLLGDEYTHLYRWNSKAKRLWGVPKVSRRYRSRFSGSHPGTGPAIFKNTAYFTDNTFPVGLYGDTYSLFSQSLLSDDDGDVSNNMDRYELKRARLSSTGEPGFMFWSVVVSPFDDSVIVWDTAGESVQSRRASDLSLNWEVRAVQLDCISIAADKGHVYFSDHDLGDNARASASDYMESMFNAKNITKYLVVAEASTGRTISKVAIYQGDGQQPSLIVPGPHDDVIFGTPVGIARLYID